MVLLDATTGLRRSELFALKWGDIDFENQTINVLRSIYGQVRNPAKREAQQRILEMILPEERRQLVIPGLNDRSAEHLDCVPELIPAELQAMWTALDHEDSFM